MPQPIRSILDGAEVVLTEGESLAIEAKPAKAPAVERRVGPAGLKAIAIRYMGFKNVAGRREYALQAVRGAEATSHKVSIELAAFSTKQALLQDGPDICYQKLLREIVGSEVPVPEGIAVTEADLADYRAAHTRPSKGFSTPRTPPAAVAKP